MTRLDKDLLEFLNGIGSNIILSLESVDNPIRACGVLDGLILHGEFDDDDQIILVLLILCKKDEINLCFYHIHILDICLVSISVGSIVGIIPHPF